MRANKWTARELMILRHEYPAKDTKEVAAMLGRSVPAVHQKAHKLGLRSGTSCAIDWTPERLKMLRTYFPIMLNPDLSKLLGVSPRSMARKAAELGLHKVPDFMERKGPEIRRRAAAGLRNCGEVSTRFKKGQHFNPSGEFKAGHRLTPEQEAKRSESLKRAWAQKKLLNKYGLTR